MRNDDTIHVSLDLETLGVSPGAAIIAIGAAAFRIGDAGLRGQFYATVTFESALRFGGVDAGTLRWWFGPDRDIARREVLTGLAVDLPEALEGFKAWFCGLHPTAQEGGEWRDATPIWGNGATFDCVLVERAFKACNIDIPWTFRDHRDLRTLKALCPPDTIWPRPEISHHAGFDAATQARQVQQAYALLDLLPRR